MASPKDRIHADIPYLVRLRRWLHARPEVGWQEHGTSRRVGREMEALGLSPVACAETGWMVDTRPGEPVRLALRADMDALPMQEQGEVPWRSRADGVMHACGHDGHMAILVGVARALVRTGAPYNVRLLFQPAEEGGAGGRRMVEEGALKGVPWVFGLHNWPSLSFGKVAVRAGAMMAASDRFEVVFHGLGCHGSQPHRGVDPILAASHFVLALQSIVSRRWDPVDAAVVSLGHIAGGTTFNVIPDTVRVEGTARALSDEGMERICGWVRQMAELAAGLVGGRAHVTWRKGYPVTCNHPGGAERVRRAVGRVLGEGACGEEGLPSMGAEDMSFLLQQVPGAYFFLGTGAPGGDSPGLHASNYDFNDGAIETGVRLFLALAEEAGLAGTPEVDRDRGSQ